MSECGWQFHGVSRAESDGRVTLTMTGWNYPTTAQRRAGHLGRVTAPEPCMTRTVAPRFTEWDGERVQLMEAGDAADMVAEHCGEPYTVMWQGRGWTVEVSSTYPLWQVTA